MGRPQRPPRVPRNKGTREIGLFRIQIALVVLGVVAAIGTSLYLRWYSPKIEVSILDHTDGTQLKQLLSSGYPVVFQCINNDIHVLPFTQSLAYWLSKSNISVFGLDCYKTLSNTNKSFFQRFKIKPPEKLDANVPLLFQFSNGQPPKQLMFSKSTNPRSMAGGVVKRGVPKLHDVKSTVDLDKLCGTRRTGCVLMLHNSSIPAHAAALSVTSSSWIQSVLDTHRLRRFVVIDTSDCTIDSLSRAGIKHRSDKIQVLGLRAASSSGFEVFPGSAFAPAELTQAFLDEFANGLDSELDSDNDVAEGLVPFKLPALPRVNKLAPPATPKKQPAPPSAKKTEAKPEPAKPDKEPSAVAEEESREQPEDWEERRRQEIQRETDKAANWVWEVSEPAVEDRAGEEEEEVLEL